MTMKLIGLARVGKDVEVRHLASGEAVVNISLAYNHGKKGDDGKRPSQWVEATLYGNRAESLAKFLTKGTSLFVDLRDVHVQTYQKRDGGTGTKLTGKVDSLDFSGNRPGNDKPQSSSTGTGFDEMDSDIPF